MKKMKKLKQMEKRIKGKWENRINPIKAMNGIKEGEVSLQCQGGSNMQFSKISQLSVIPKSILFSLLLTLSWASTAQDHESDSLNAVSVEVEQVNINHADAPTIARMLDGVGISRAEAIVNFRDEYGDFASLEELLLVNGVGEVTLRNNQARISFE
jgi:competence protein ComEA